MPRIELAISVADGQKTAVVSRLEGPGTLKEVAEILAVGVHNLLTMAEKVDRDANKDGKLLGAVIDRIEQLNRDPEYAGQINCRIEMRKEQG